MMQLILRTMMISMFFTYSMQANQDIREIMAPQLLAALVKQKDEGDSGLTVINVLNYNSYKDCHIKKSIHLPMHALKSRAKHRFNSGKWKKDKMLVVYCANRQCPLSRQAYKILTDIGFTNVWAYEGGMHDWMQHNKKYSGYHYPVIGNACGGYLHE